MQINIDGVTKFQSGQYPAPLPNGATHWATFIWKGHKCSIVGSDTLDDDILRSMVIISPSPQND